MQCFDRATLNERYSDASAIFEAASESLHKKRAVLSRQEYDALRNEVYRASEVMQIARAALNRHIREHGCEA